LFPPAPPYNFVVTYSVVLPYPPDKVFSVLGSGSNLEAIARLSSAAQDFTPGETVKIPLPERGVENSRGNQLSEPVKDGEAGVKRTSFTMKEKFSTLLGLIESHIDIIGCQTESPTRDCVMYESYAAKQRIWIHKLRQFKPHGEGSTLVDERIEGTCPAWLKWSCERGAKAAHREHMNSYHQLFDQ